MSDSKPLIDIFYPDPVEGNGSGEHKETDEAKTDSFEPEALNVRKGPPTDTTEPETKQQPIDDDYPPSPGEDFADLNLENTYRRKGFYTAINKHNDPSADGLNEILAQENRTNAVHLSKIEYAHNQKIQKLTEQYNYLNYLLAEKYIIKHEYEQRLKDLKNEYAKVLGEVEQCNADLRQVISGLGTDKDDLINKRIAEFDKELKASLNTYKEAEELQNQKFAADFAGRNIQPADKRFYAEYRDRLMLHLEDVQNRMRKFEALGLNFASADVLIFMGWIAAFASSWFFSMWYPQSSGVPNVVPTTVTTSANADTANINTNIISYIFDNLRLFFIDAGYTWYIKLLIISGYLAGVMLVAWTCHWLAKREKFPARPNEDVDSIKLNTEGVVRAEFKAGGWYEFWLKITPFLAAVAGLVFILAISSARGNTYEQLSDSLSAELVGFLIPVGVSALFYLYVSKVVEQRALRADNGGPQVTWEITLGLIAFVSLIIVFVVYKSGAGFVSKGQLAAWGFFIGCLATGFAFAYGYRMSSLHQSYESLVERIDVVNGFILRNFYPFEASFLKDATILRRMRDLMHSLLSLSESRNRTALTILNPFLKTDDYKKSQLGKEVATATATTTESNPTTETTKDEPPTGNVFRRFMNGLLNGFKREVNRLRRIVTRKSKELNDLKKTELNIFEIAYFPGVAAKIAEIKSLVEQKERRLYDLRTEIYGRYLGESTSASLDMQIKKLEDRKVAVANGIQQSKIHAVNRTKRLMHIHEKKKTFIQEGYNVGVWVSLKNNPLI